MVSVNRLTHSVLLEAFCPRHVKSNADNAFALQGTAIETDSILGVVATAFVLRTSVVRGVREAAEVDIHVGNEWEQKMRVWN